MADAPIVILGAGLAGGNAAKTLREEGYDGALVLIGDEPGVPFGRPPLSKTYLRGEEELDGWFVKPPEWFEQHNIEHIRETATRLDDRKHQITLRSGRTIAYSKLLIATGGRNRSLPLPGALQLRTQADADAIRERAKPGSHALVVGMGFIGCEVAASLIQLGVRVTAVLRGGAPLEKVLGPEMGAMLASIHKENGVEIITPDEPTETDFTVVAVGIQPNVEILQGTQVAIDNGVLVDAALRTSVEDIWAAGDVANHDHPRFGRLRVEHYNNAEKQGAAVARAMLGSTAPYDYLHTFWSDQYEHKLEYVGFAREWDEFVIRGSLKDRRLVGLYRQRGVLQAAVGFNRGGDPELEPDSEMAALAAEIATKG